MRMVNFPLKIEDAEMVFALEISHIGYHNNRVRLDKEHLSDLNKNNMLTGFYGKHSRKGVVISIFQAIIDVYKTMRGYDNYATRCRF